LCNDGRPTPFAADSGFAAEGTRREPAELILGEGVSPAPSLPLKPTISQRNVIANWFKEKEQC